MRVEDVLNQLIAVDPDVAVLRSIWIQRHTSALAETLDCLSEISDSDPELSKAIRTLLDGASPKRVGMALTSPACLWGLRYNDRGVMRRELLISAADAVGGDIESLREHLLPYLVEADRRVLPNSGLQISGGSPPRVLPHPHFGRLEDFGVAIIAGDSLLASALVDGHPQVVEPTAFLGFQDTLRRALVQISECTPGLSSTIRGLLRVVVPMKSPKFGVPSSSSNTVPGAVWLTEHSDPEILAEQLTHECTHALLFLCQEVDPILDPEVYGDGWSQPLMYSPWRDDPRPLAGLLHGAVVFLRVALFHERRAPDSFISRRRLAALAPQLAIAAELLEGVRFTDVGRAFISRLLECIKRIVESSELYRDEHPEYLECSGIHRLEGGAWKRQCTHRETVERTLNARRGAPV